MSLFSRLLGGPDPFTKRAEGLVDTAHLFAIGSATPLLAKYQSFRGIDPKKWDFVVTVAGVYVATFRLDQMRTDGRIDDSRRVKLMAIIQDRLNRWNPSGLPSLGSCIDFFDREIVRLNSVGREERFIAVDAIGGWIIRNTLGHTPGTDDEHALVREIGTATLHTFANWWS